MELLGLEWKDFDFDNNIVTVNRTSNYTGTMGVFTNTPKTKSSYRSLKLPAEVMEFVVEYKTHQQNYINALGDKWEEDTDRLLLAAMVSLCSPICPDIISKDCANKQVRVMYQIIASDT